MRSAGRERYTSLTDRMNRMFIASPDPGELIDLFAEYDPPRVDKWIGMKKGL